jgi:glycosyltransferase involved in cell wall biosynthesis
MKIAMIGQKGMPAVHGGVERHVHELASRLVAHGFSVRAYARSWYTKKTPRFVDGVELVYTPSLHTKHLDTITHTFLSTIHAMRSDIDIMHYHGVGPSLISWIPRIFTPRIRVITTFHSIDRKHRKWGALARFILRLGEKTACMFAHQTIAVSQTIQQYARDVYDAQLTYVPNGVTIKAPVTRTSALSHFDLKPNEYVLMVSRLIPHKGAHYLIGAWKQFQKTHAELAGGKKLVIVGDGHYTDAYVGRLQYEAKDDDSIIFTGFQTGETLDQLFAHAALFVHPSENEGMPLVVLEAMSHALPVLVSNIPEHRDLITRPAYLFHPGSVDDLVKKLVVLLKKNRAVLEKDGQMNRTIVAAEYDWDQVCEKIERLYTSEYMEIPRKAVLIPHI